MIKIDKTSRIMINSNPTIQRKSVAGIKHKSITVIIKAIKPSARIAFFPLFAKVRSLSFLSEVISDPFP